MFVNFLGSRVDFKYFGSLLGMNFVGNFSNDDGTEIVKLASRCLQYVACVTR